MAQCTEKKANSATWRWIVLADSRKELSSNDITFRNLWLVSCLDPREQVADGLANRKGGLCMEFIQFASGLKAVGRKQLVSEPNAEQDAAGQYVALSTYSHEWLEF
jgi:hypothetical protein